METVSDFIFLGPKITADDDCSHEIKRCLLLGRKVMTNLDRILKSRDITLSTKVRLVKAVIFPVVVYGCESWTVTNDQNRLTPEELERMVNDAEKFAEEDKKLKERIDTRNELESYAYSLKNQIGDKEKLGGKLSSEDKETMEKAVSSARFYPPVS